MESLVHIILGNALAATVLAIVAVGAGRICRRPAVTHSLWLIVLLKLVTPPIVPISLPGVDAVLPIASSSLRPHADRDQGHVAQVEPLTKLGAEEDTRFVDSEPILSAAPVDVADDALEIAKADRDPRSSDLADTEKSMPFGLPFGWKWEPAVFIVILSGALGWWALAAVRIIRFQRLLRDVRPVRGELQSHTDELAEQVGLGQRPAVCLVPGRVPPMLWAIGGRPRLLVPAQLWSTMKEDERTSLLLHELAHLRRRDHWVRWLELVVAGLYWWHPVVWWARRALREAEEQCCDAWVVWAMPQRARTYAAALLAAVEFVSGARGAPAVASATSGNGHVSCLKRRLRMIVRAKTPKGLSWAGRIAVLGVAGLLLPLAPSWARHAKLSPTEPGRSTAVDESKQSTEAQPSERAVQRANDLYALLIGDDDKDKDDDDDKEEKTRDAAQRFQEQLTGLIGKIGNEFRPVTEEIRKALERAVGELHKSLDKEKMSVEELGKALEKSQDELKKAFEGGGPVDKELREAIDHSRKELEEALERGKTEVQGQVETLRQKSLELGEKARENLERAKETAEKGLSPEAEGELNREELEVARKEIRELEQQLRKSTRRLEELQRRELRRVPGQRRERFQRESARPEPAPTPSAEPASPQPPRPPAVPPTPAIPARPARPEMRRPQPPSRPGPGGARRGPQDNSERRIQELEEKMKSLLKELETIKEEKAPKESGESSSRNARPAKPALPTNSYHDFVGQTF